MSEPPDNVFQFPIGPQVQNMLRDAIRNMSGAGDGGGSSTGLEARVAVLEAHVDILRKDLAEAKGILDQVRLQLATVTERIAHLPSKSYTVTIALAVMAVVAAFTTFQQQIQHFVHLVP